MDCRSLFKFDEHLNILFADICTWEIEMERYSSVFKGQIISRSFEFQVFSADSGNIPFFSFVYPVIKVLIDTNNF
jgi:hypothetical protein